MCGASPDGRLHVLVYGSLDAGVADFLRVGCLVEPLGRQGVEVRSWQSFGDDVLAGGAPAEASAEAPAEAPGPPRDALVDLGLTALAWAHVVVFRRWRSTHAVCTECETPFPSPAPLEAHARATGHRTLMPDLLVRPVVALLDAHPELLGDRAVLYDADDDVLDYPTWTGLGFAAQRERDLVLRIMGLADVVSAATPVLAERLAPHTRGQVVVIANALDPAWYASSGPADLPGDPRVLYHGVPVRLRDYEVARSAVNEVAASRPALRRVWLGASHEPAVVACMDEVRPWVDGVPAFAAALSAARPDVGLAPLLDESFNRAKSELHWLEYSLAGAATIATAFDGPGPFDAIRDGVDGLLARTPSDWRRHLAALAASRDLRTTLAGRARERVLDDYSLARRVGEWAAIYRFAAAHPGLGRLPAARLNVSRSTASPLK